MPEGPEVKLYVKLLNLYLGNQIDSWDIISGRYKRSKPEGWDQFSAPVGLDFVGCKGKFVFFKLSSGKYIWQTLGMTGGWHHSPQPNARYILNGRITYTDTRNFGTLKFNMSKDETLKKLNSLGWDLLSDSHDHYEIARFVVKRPQTLAQILMNQKIFAGVGNYVKAEVLYRARLSPHRTGKSLNLAEAVSLVGHVEDVLTESFGSKPFVFANYQECGKDFEKVVYRRSEDPWGNPVVSEKTKDKRTTWWVPAIQV